MSAQMMRLVAASVAATAVLGQSQNTCDTQYDKISALCCTPAGSSSRRLQTADIFDCTLPKMCSKACAAMLPAFYAKCGKSLALDQTDNGLKRFVTSCSSSGSSGGTGGGWKKTCGKRCTYNYALGTTKTAAAAEAKCASNSSCTGVYASGSSWTTPGYKYARFYQCKPGEYYPKTTSTSSCVATKPGATLIAGPNDSCSSSPCLNGAKCTSYDTRKYNSKTRSYGAYYSAFRCTCVKPYVGTTCDAKLTNTCVSSPCVNGGMCTPSRYQNAYSCSCPKGATGGLVVGGKNCATKYDDPCESDPCKNGGTCSSYASTYSTTVSYNCRCAAGYAGRSCESKLAPKAGVCAGSVMQRCKMMCPNKVCPSGTCLMHTDSCCGRSCRAISASTCSSSDCCWTGSNNYCACKDTNPKCKAVRCFRGPPKGACSKPSSTCTSTQTTGGKKFTSCGTACPLTCGQRQGFMCNMMCVVGCQCARGMYTDPKKGGKCVVKSACTTPPPPPLQTGGRGGIAIGRPFTEGACNSHVTAEVLTGSEW